MVSETPAHSVTQNILDVLSLCPVVRATSPFKREQSSAYTFRFGGILTGNTPVVLAQTDFANESKWKDHLD